MARISYFVLFEYEKHRTSGAPKRDVDSLIVQLEDVDDPLVEFSGLRTFIENEKPDLIKGGRITKILNINRL